MQSNYTTFLQDAADTFVTKTVYSGPDSDVDKVNIEWKDRSNAEITLDEENSKYTLNGKSLKDDTVEALNNFYNKLTALQYDDFILECPVDKNADSEITITYVKKDGTKDAFDFYKVDDENYAVFMNGEYQNFTVIKKNFTAREGIYDFYDRLLDAAEMK